MKRKLLSERVDLDRELIFKIMSEELERRSVRYNKDMLQQYINMKIPVTNDLKTMWKKAITGTVTKGTVMNWVGAFACNYTEERY